MNTDISLNQLIDDFVSERDIVSISAKTYKNTLRVFITWLTQNVKEVRNPTVADIVLYKKFLKDNHHTALTIDSYMRILALWFKWLEYKGYYTNIVSGIHSCKKYYGYRKGYLTEEEVIILLRSCKGVTLYDKRTYAIVNLMVRTGFRCVEVSRLNIQDLKIIKTGYSLDLQRKGSTEKNQVFGITSYEYEPIESYLLERKGFTDNDPLFSTIGHHKKSDRINAPEVGRIVNNALVKAGLKRKDISAHSLRHTFAIAACNANVLLHDLSVALGHRSSSTTELYLSAANADTLITNPAVAALGSIYDFNE